jgi:four helix bundle protein
MEEKTLENLKIWQESMDLAVTICQKILPSFPIEEKWAMTSQLRRAVQSIPANIAEGYGPGDYPFLLCCARIAIGDL